MTKFRISLAVLLLALGSTRLYAVDIAILDSDVNTAGWFRISYPAPVDYNEYMRYWLGWKYVLECENNGQYKNRYIPLKDWQLQKASDLVGVKVLILADTIRLADNQVKAIDTWVRAGGRLIATFGSGYLGFASSLSEDTALKGKTFGLHQLWHDPMTKVYGTDLIGAIATWVQITKSTGPTSVFQLGASLPYGRAAQLLTQQTDNDRSAVAKLILSPPDTTGRVTAVVNTKASKGLVVYFAFAPEYIVSWEFVPEGGETLFDQETEHFTCGQQITLTPDQQQWWTAFPFEQREPAPYDPYGSLTSAPLRKLMKGAIDYMMTAP